MRPVSFSNVLGFVSERHRKVEVPISFSGGASGGGDLRTGATALPWAELGVSQWMELGDILMSLLSMHTPIIDHALIRPTVYHPSTHLPTQPS